MRTSRSVRPLLLVALALLAALLAVAAALPGAGPARAASSTDGNPWTYTMSADAPGMRIYGSTGGGNRELEIFDHANQPIFGVNEAGGAWVAGDEFRIFAGGDIIHGQITLSAGQPNPSVCVRNGQLWIGGTDGRIWRCADLDGGTWNGSWWLAL